MSNQPADDNADDSFDEEFDFLDDQDFNQEEESDGTVARTSPTDNQAALKKLVMIGSAIAIGVGILYNLVIDKERPAPTKSATTTVDTTTESTAKKNNQMPAANSTALQISEMPISLDDPLDDDNSADFNQIAESLGQPSQLQTTQELPFEETVQVTPTVPTDNKTTVVNTPATVTIPEPVIQNLSKVENSLDTISGEISQNIQQVQELESSMTNLARTLANLNKSISAMDNRVLSLTETVDSLSQDLQDVKQTIVDEDLDLTSPNKANSQDQLVYSAPEYAIHAIIPGRAWLKSSNGHIVTVTEGDTIGDYGTIAAIDANNNLVRTSSGVSFR